MAEIEFKPEYIDRLEPQALAECVDPDTAAIMREIFRRARAYQPPATPGPSIGEAANEIMIPMRSASGDKYALCLSGPFEGWICWKHPDGQWVSAARASEDQIAVARAHHKMNLAISAPTPAGAIGEAGALDADVIDNLARIIFWYLPQNDGTWGDADHVYRDKCREAAKQIARMARAVGATPPAPAAGLTWTKGGPKAEGWYWVWDPEDENEPWIEWFNAGYVWTCSTLVAGPIPPMPGINAREIKAGQDEAEAEAREDKNRRALDP